MSRYIMTAHGCISAQLNSIHALRPVFMHCAALCNHRAVKDACVRGTAASLIAWPPEHCDEAANRYMFANVAVHTGKISHENRSIISFTAYPKDLDDSRFAKLRQKSFRQHHHLIMAPANITVIGSLNIDHIFFVDRLPFLGESYEAKDYRKALGGKGANAAIAAYRSCHKKSDAEPREQLDTDIHVRMVGAVGSDLDGKWMKDTIKEAMVDVSGVRTEPDVRTGMTFIIVEEPKDEEHTRDNRLIYTIGANATLKPAHFSKVEALSNGTRPDLVISQLEIALETVETILKTAHSNGIPILLNAAPANVILPELYCCITHLLVNETEAAMLYGCDVDEVKEESWEKIAKFFLDAGVKNFVITLGAKGAFYAGYEAKPLDSLGAKQIIKGPVERFIAGEVIDPTGAG